MQRHVADMGCGTVPPSRCFIHNSPYGSNNESPFVGGHGSKYRRQYMEPVQRIVSADSLGIAAVYEFFALSTLSLMLSLSPMSIILSKRALYSAASSTISRTSCSGDMTP